MTNHPNRNGKYELTFVGGASAYARSILGNYKRHHKTFESAKKTALHYLNRFDVEGTRAAHSAIVYGPDFTADGWSIR